MFGHIHEGYGVKRDPNAETTFINASSCNFDYWCTNPPIVFDVVTSDASDVELQRESAEVVTGARTKREELETRRFKSDELVVAGVVIVESDLISWDSAQVSQWVEAMTALTRHNSSESMTEVKVNTPAVDLSVFTCVEDMSLFVRYPELHRLVQSEPLSWIWSDNSVYSVMATMTGAELLKISMEPREVAMAFPGCSRFHDNSGIGREIVVDIIKVLYIGIYCLLQATV